MGAPSALAATRDEPGAVVGWSWEIKRAGNEPRRVRVEVHVRSGSRVTDLPEVAKHAIRSRGATAVDAVLGNDDPPERIVVSAHGVQAGPAGAPPRRPQAPRTATGEPAES